MEPKGSFAERAVRIIQRVCYVIIGLFLVAFALFVLAIVFEAPARALRFLAGSVSSPIFWMILAGPVTFWIAVLAINLRLPREIRSGHVGTLGMRIGIHAVLAIFAEYRAQFGFGPLLWTVFLSGTITVALLWLSMWGMEERPTLWLIFISSLWLAFATWLLFFSARRKRPGRPNVVR